MTLIDQGLIPESNEYLKRYYEYLHISNQMMLCLSTTSKIWKNQDFTDICYEICYSKNLGPTQWKIIWHFIENRNSRKDLNNDIAILRKYLDNMDCEHSELYDEFKCFIKK
jgi:hypothetical protein